MAIAVEVKPKDKTRVGWDVAIMSWKPDGKSLTVHRLTWSQESKGVFVGTTGDLPSGEYLVRAELVGPGVQVDVEVRRNASVTQPAGKDWPMTVKVDGAVQAQNSDTWYFGYTK